MKSEKKVLREWNTDNNKPNNKIHRKRSWYKKNSKKKNHNKLTKEGADIKRIQKEKP